MKSPITIIITCNNEAHNMKALLESAQWAAEIMVIDSFSTDQTLSIARQYDTTIFQRTYSGPADQKNWAIPQAKYEWVLILDADERVTPELKTEIQTIIKKESQQDAYWIRRKNYFMGQHIRYSGWGNDAVIRLIQRDKCHYNKKQVHEEIDTTNIQVGQLNTYLTHNTFRDIDHYLAKVQRYAKWSAKDYLIKTPRVTWFHLYGKPAFRFFKHFFLQKGFLDGKVGFIISSIMAWSVFLRYVHLQQLKADQKLKEF